LLTISDARLTFYDMKAIALAPATKAKKAREEASSVGFLLVPGFALMSYTAAVEPLRAANLLSGRTLYRWWHASPGGAPVIASNGVVILPDVSVGTERDADVLFVCAGGNPATFNDRTVFAWLRKLARRGVTIGGISGGPFVLANAGILGDHRVTLHWEHQPAFREAFPDIAVTQSLFEIDGNRITCSGGISALDMMVALIERDHGRQLAASVGDWFLHTHIREGMGPQRMDLRVRLGVTDQKLLRVLRAMETAIETPQSRGELAKIAGVSVRQLERLFQRHLGHGIHKQYRSMRLERARQLLRETAFPVLDVAVATGFSSASQFSRAYTSAFGESPTRTRMAG
jgi:transcriptional regulator GlxA family with amidase domain